MNQPKKISSTRQIVSLIPNVLGYVPSQSLVIVPCNGAVSGAVVRMDIPEDVFNADAESRAIDHDHGVITITESARAAEYAQLVVEQVARLRDCTAAIIGIFTSEQPKCVRCDTEGHCDRESDCFDLLPGESLVDALERAFTDVGIEPLSAFVVCPQHWFDYWSADHGPTSELLERNERRTNDTLAERARIPKASAKAIGNVQSLCEQQTEQSLPTDDEVLCAWNLLVDGTDWIASDHQSTLYAVVLMGLQRMRTTECLLANAAYGQDAADEMGRIWDTLNAEISEHEMQGMTAARTEYDPVDQDRCLRAINVLKQVVAHATGTRVIAALAALAWVEWCRGASSLAHYYSNEALRAGEHEIASQIYEYVISGAVPGWVDGSSCVGPIRDAEVDRILQ